MDIIFIERSPMRHRDFIQEHSFRTHDRAFGQGRRVMLSGMGSISDVQGGILTALMVSGIGEEVVVSYDTTFIAGDFDITKPHCAMRSLWMARKGVEQTAMVETIKWLIANTAGGTKDFEVKVPHLFKKDDLIATLELCDDGPTKLMNTMHFNRMDADPVRIEDAYMDFWKWNHPPTGPVATLGDACYANKDCLRWVKAL